MGRLEKATITNTVSGDRIPVLFNPEEYSLKREINYAQAAVPGLSAPILQFVNGNLQTLDMELMLDSYERHTEGGRTLADAHSDVRVQTRKITTLMDIDRTTHAPPVLLFTWASLTFTCVLARATQQFLVFLPDGTPVRARLQVTFNEFRNADLEAKEIKRETADYSKLHVVLQGETLSSIAAAVYGDPTLWRPIAIRNDVDVPAAIAVGERLVVPSLPYRDAATGEVFQ
jgi:nucleoid-associated protein YgaU